jgi:hypothetical protein
MDAQEIELDAYQIADKVFSSKTIDTNYSFENLDLKTLFEMLIIIVTEGLKKFYGVDNKINIVELTTENITNINNYMKKIGVKTKLKTYDDNTWNQLQLYYLIQDYRTYNIRDDTKLSDLNFVHSQDFKTVISFDFL